MIDILIWLPIGLILAVAALGLVVGALTAPAEEPDPDEAREREEERDEEFIALPRWWR